MVAVTMWVTALLLSLSVQAPPLAEDKLFQEGLALYNDVEYEDAIARFTDAAAVEGRDPSDKAQVLAWLGTSHGQLGDFDAAKQAFEQAVALDPDVQISATLPPKIEAVLAEAREAERARRAHVDQAPPPIEAPAEEQPPWPLIAAGSTGAAGGALLLVGGGLIALSAVTASGLSDRTTFQSDMKERLDAANAQLGTGYAFSGLGVALLGAGAAIYAVTSMAPPDEGATATAAR